MNLVCDESRICNEFQDNDRQSSFVLTYGGMPRSRVLADSRNFVLVVDLSPIVRGHVLLAPKVHYLSLATAIGQHLGEFRQFIAQVRRVYCEAYGSCVVLEHGSSPDDARRSSCISHAHWHILPFNTELARYIDADELSGVRTLVRWSDLALAQRAAPYFLYWDNVAIKLFETTHLPYRQYVRSLVGRHLGMSTEEWDWTVVIRKELFYHTYEDLIDRPW
jgi:diadenosine tetraphosphate (Ap4A) HIT family hydrolase